MDALRSLAAAFARDGYVVLPGALDTATVARARGWCDAVLARWRAAHPDAGDTTNIAWLTEPRWWDDPAELAGFLDLIAGDDILALLTEIGAPPLFNNTQYSPEPLAKSWPGVWHRDCQFLFPARDDAGEARIRASFGSAHVRYALVDEACLEVVPGSHLRPDTPAEAAVRWDKTARTGAMPGAEMVAVAAGDVMLLHAWALHRGHYRVDEPRRTLDVIWQWGGKLDDFVPPPTCFTDAALLARLSPGARAAFARYVETYAADWDAGAHAWAEAAMA